MTDKKRASGLGRGLSDLLGDNSSLNEDISELDRVKQHKLVNIESLIPSPFQPRHTFDEESLNNLVDSIKEKGVLQPLLVRRDPNDNARYEIIAGERRFRASQIAGLKELPVIVKEMSDQEVLEVALIENIQRQDLNAIEEAEGYNRLIEEFNHTQEELSKIVGKSRSHVANTMRLLTLSPKIQKYVIEGKLTAGHARALITAKNPEDIAEKIISKGLNVRQVEKLAQEVEKKPGSKTNNEQKQDDAKALSTEVEKMIGTKVSIKFKDHGGEITIAFANNVILDILLKRLTEEGMLSDQPVRSPNLKEGHSTENTGDDLTENINSSKETIPDNIGVSSIVDTIMGEDTSNQTASPDVVNDNIETNVPTEENTFTEAQPLQSTVPVTATEEIITDADSDVTLAPSASENQAVVANGNNQVMEEDIAPLNSEDLNTEKNKSPTAELNPLQEALKQQPQQGGMTKEEVEKLLQETIEDVKPNFDGLENIVTEDDDAKKNFKIPDKQEIVFDENIKI